MAGNTDRMSTDVQYTCLGLVTARMIQLRQMTRSALVERELEALTPVAEWLLEEGLRAPGQDHGDA